MREWLAFAALTAIWGASFLLIKMGLDGFEPLTLVAVRVFLGSAFLVVYQLARRMPFPTDRRFFVGAFAIALLNTSFPFFLITWGEKFIDSGIAAILNATTTLFTLLFSVLLHRAARLPRLLLTSVGLGFAGVVVVMTRGGTEGALIGKAAVLLAALCYGLSAVIMTRYLHRYHFLPVIALATVISTLMNGVAAFLLESPDPLAAPPHAWFGVVALGLLGTGVAFALLVFVIRSWGATRTSMITYAIPVVGVALGAGVRNEALTWHVFAGGGLIGLSLLLANRTRRIGPE